MIKVRFFGKIRIQIQTSYMDIEANSIDELFRKIEKNNDNIKYKELKKAIIFVNDVNILKLTKYKTPLQSGDEVVILSPVGGG